jgi:gliding motility-associated-like protein
MKKITLFILSLFVVNTIFTQVFTISSGTVSMGASSTLTLEETSLSNNGSFKGKNGSVINAKTSDKISLKGSNPIQFHTLNAQGNIDLETDLSLEGNLILNSGLMNLNNSELYLGGQLIGENNSKYIYTEGTGEIVKIIDLEANQKSDLGFIGLEVTAFENIPRAEFRRGHSLQSNGTQYSVSRYFNLPASEDILSVSFNYLNNEIKELDPENLSAFIYINNRWQPVSSIIDPQRPNYIQANLITGAKMVTLFESLPDEEIIIPGGISPNNDGQNDLFVIPGVHNYPDNKLVIFNKWGEILIEKEPYENDWGGENENSVGVANDNLLPDGTYFYIFLKDKNDKNSVLKGSIEIKIGNK